MDKQSKIRTSVSFQPETWERLKARAAKERVSLSDVAEWGAVIYLDIKDRQDDIRAMKSPCAACGESREDLRFPYCKSCREAEETLSGFFGSGDDKDKGAAKAPGDRGEPAPAERPSA